MWYYKHADTTNHEWKIVKDLVEELKKIRAKIQF